MVNLNCVNVVKVDGHVRIAYSVNRQFERYAEPKDFGSVRNAEEFLDKKFRSYTPSAKYDIVVHYEWKRGTNESL